MFTAVKQNGTTVLTPQETRYVYDDVGMLKTVTPPNGVYSDYNLFQNPSWRVVLNVLLWPRQGGTRHAQDATNDH